MLCIYIYIYICFFVCVGRRHTKGKEPQDAERATLNSELMRGRGENNQAHGNRARKANSYFLKTHICIRETEASELCALLKCTGSIIDRRALWPLGNIRQSPRTEHK